MHCLPYYKWRRWWRRWCGAGAAAGGAAKMCSRQARHVFLALRFHFLCGSVSSRVKSCVTELIYLGYPSIYLSRVPIYLSKLFPCNGGTKHLMYRIYLSYFAWWSGYQYLHLIYLSFLWFRCNISRVYESWNHKHGSKYELWCNISRVPI
jgi:hypothetical protein